MKIVTRFDGQQKKFHWYWLPLMYKHPECKFYISGDFIFPRGIDNLLQNATPEEGDGPILQCPINLVPTYKAMVELSKKKKDWNGTHEDLGERFYEV